MEEDYLFSHSASGGLKFIETLLLQYVKLNICILRLRFGVEGGFGRGVIIMHSIFGLRLVGH